MANLSALVQWEVRPTAGNDNNGGGFKAGASGTDYSQQVSAQYALTTATSSGAGDTILDASAATDMVGNVAQVLSGTNFRTGFFEIVSVVAGVSITFSQNSSGLSICTGTGSAGTLNIGGALATIAKIMNASTPAANNNKIWVKNTGTHTITTAILGLPIYIELESYGSTRGDAGRTTITTATNSTKLFNWSSGAARSVFRNFIFTNTAATRASGFDSTNAEALVWVNCLFDGFTYAYFGGKFGVEADAQNAVAFIDCEIKNCTTTDGAIELENPKAVMFEGCWIHDNAGHGVQAYGDVAAGMVAFINTVLSKNGKKGYDDNNTGSGVFQSFLFVNSCARENAEDGIYFNGATNQALIEIRNSIFWDNGTGGTGYGVYRTATSQAAPNLMFGHSNAFGGNATGARGGVWPTLSGDVALTADPHTNAAAGDFTLNATAGGGAVCKAAGWESGVF